MGRFNTDQSNAPVPRESEMVKSEGWKVNVPGSRGQILNIIQSASGFFESQRPILNRLIDVHRIVRLKRTGFEMMPL